MNRREFLSSAAAVGAMLALPCAAQASRLRASTSPGAYPQGVASADPAPDGFIAWTRRPPVDGRAARRLMVEIARDPDFREVVATSAGEVSAASDWTARALVRGLAPDTVHWYRFVDEHGLASRTGRAFTAPVDAADVPARFAFVSCQNINMGYCTAYRHLLREDRARPSDERIRFVLHLGDFIYEMVFRPEDNPGGMQGRALRSVEMPHGRRVGRFVVPSTLDDYRALYRAYLSDPDLQDARAEWPFVCVWDNHEFSHGGWQSQLVAGDTMPAQTLKVAANQAWFEYIPARVRPGTGTRVDRFEAPRVVDTELTAIDADGLSHEPNNLAAIHSLAIQRALRWGRNVELVLTDNRSFRARPVMSGPAAEPFQGASKVPWFVPQDLVHALDAGRTANGGHPLATLRHAGGEVPNPRVEATPPSMLGAAQKRWLLDRLTESTAVWKLWGNSVGMLDRRTDLQRLPAALATGWPSEGFGMLGPDDWAGYASERAEVLGALQAAGTTNVASLAGDRHAFFAGTLSAGLPPVATPAVGVEFIVGSLGTPTLFEAAVDALPAAHPYRGLFIVDDAAGARPALNVALRHGVRSALALADGEEAARSARAPDVAPHLAFADLDGHGYARVRADGEALAVEFVGLPAPVSPDDPDALYRVTHRVPAWSPGEAPRVERAAEEGAPELAFRYLDRRWG